MFYYFIINSITVIVCFVFGSVFLAVPVPQNKYLTNYKISLKYLAINYFVYALLNILIMYSYSDEFTESLSFFTTLLSSIQALLFTSTLLTLFNPVFVNKRFIIKHLIPILSFSILYLICNILLESGSFESGEDTLAIALKVVNRVFIAYYFFLLFFYTYLFNREKKKYQFGVDNYFSSSANLKLGWVEYMFYSALFIGIMALGFQLFYSPYLDLFFSLCVTIFYFIFSMKYINYNKVFELIEPALVELSTVEKNEMSTSNKISRTWNEYKQEILDEKYYLKTGLTLNDLAKLICIGRSTLSNFINNDEGVSFNTWINTLRINDAKTLIAENPELTIAQISEMTGYSEQSNFSRHFKLVTGTTPSGWKKLDSKSQ